MSCSRNPPVPDHVVDRRLVSCVSRTPFAPRNAAAPTVCPHGRPRAAARARGQGRCIQPRPPMACHQTPGAHGRAAAAPQRGTRWPRDRHTSVHLYAVPARARGGRRAVRPVTGCHRGCHRLSQAVTGAVTGCHRLSQGLSQAVTGKGGQSVGWAKSMNRASVTTDDRFKIDFFTCRQRGLHAAENRRAEVPLRAPVPGCCSRDYRRCTQSSTHPFLSSSNFALLPVVLLCASPAPRLAFLRLPRPPPCFSAPPPLPAFLFGASPAPIPAFWRLSRSRPCFSAPPSLAALPLGASPAPLLASRRLLRESIVGDQPRWVSRPCFSAPPSLAALPLGASPAPLLASRRLLRESIFGDQPRWVRDPAHLLPPRWHRMPHIVPRRR